MQDFNQWQEAHGPERRFRASIYVDIFVPQTDDLEADRARAAQRVEAIKRHIPNSYVGGVAYYNPHGNPLNPLDKDI